MRARARTIAVHYIRHPIPCYYSLMGTSVNASKSWLFNWARSTTTKIVSIAKWQVFLAVQFAPRRAIRRSLLGNSNAVTSVSGAHNTNTIFLLIRLNFYTTSLFTGCQFESAAHHELDLKIKPQSNAYAERWLRANRLRVDGFFFAGFSLHRPLWHTKNAHNIQRTAPNHWINQ